MRHRPGFTAAQIEERLRSAKIRPTAQRIAICRYVLSESDHPTAEDVKRWADSHFSKMSLATVYNTLGALARAGVIKEVRLPHSDAVAYDHNTTDHHHFIDESTGRIEDIPLDAVQVRLKLGGKYVVRNLQVVIRGAKK